MAESILTLFRRNALRLGVTPCFHYKDKNTWKNLSWFDAEETVRRYTLGLAALGLKPGGAAAILSQTRMEWTLLDLSILANQAITVPIYPTLAADQVAYILKDAKVSLLIVEDVFQWERLKPYLKEALFPIVLIQGEAQGFINLEMLREKGKSLPVNLYDENLKAIQPVHAASYIYTSGTTGQQKGCIITHRNILAEVQGLQEVFHFTPSEIGFMCLPLAHVIARAMQFFHLGQGCQTAYAENMDMIPVNLREIRPHFMAGVPRLYEKVHEKILNKVHQSSKPLQRLFNWSLDVGMNRSDGLWSSLCRGCANILVYKKIKKAFGGRVKIFVSGGAPLDKEIARFFHALGILVVEGYGLTETFAAMAINRPDDFRFGTVGKPLEGVRIKVANDGEICVKGDTVFAGYLNLKAETEATFDNEGWFLTGDIGEFSKDGFLRITDRKKDIIKTSGGKMIAPQNIENLMQQSRYIQQIMVYGDRQKFLSALVTLNWDAVENYAKTHNIPFSSRQDLSRNDQITELIHQEIEGRNKSLSHFETIRKFAILDTSFSIETGELTPTMKIKRKIVVEKYKTILDGLYNNEH